MQEFKVGDLVEVVRNISHAYKNTVDIYEPGDRAIVTEVSLDNVRIGCDKYGNLISKNEIKKVEQSPELTEYEEEIVLRLAEKIKEKDKLERNMNNLMNEIQCSEELAKITEKEYEKISKEIKEISKKLLTK